MEEEVDDESGEAEITVDWEERRERVERLWVGFRREEAADEEVEEEEEEMEERTEEAEETVRR
jgi:hypothetical protein